MPEGVENSNYARLGVDAGKANVRRAFRRHIDNEFPNAFVNIVSDPLKRGWVRTQHMDGDGSKFVQRLLNFSETGDITVLRGAVDDALQMNLGDIASSGFVFGPIMVTDVININGLNIPKDLILNQIGERFGELMEIYRKFGFNIAFLGGETADLPTPIQSTVFDVCVSAHAKRADIITGDVKAGDKIYGFASDGKASWENEDNSGVMSNGLTLARVTTMWEGYMEKYPYLGLHKGRFKVGEKAPPPFDFVISDALISPTRQWAILIKYLLEELKKDGIYSDLHALTLNTGGGATKISHVGDGILYQKSMPQPPDFFQFIKQESGEKWKDMFKGFNCGVGLDIVGADTSKFRDVLEKVSNNTNVELFELGDCRTSTTGRNQVCLTTGFGVFNY